MRPLSWLPPVAWMAVIFLLSTDTGSAEHTRSFLLPLFRLVGPAAAPEQLEALHGLTRKAAHLTEYGVLAALWFRALTTGRGWPASVSAWAALAISVGWAVLDEAHQSWVASRTASLSDAGIDTVGALVASLVAARGWRAVVDTAVTVLLWIAAVGGAATLALNLAVGLPPGWLWLTTPLAALILVDRWRLMRGRPSGDGS